MKKFKESVFWKSPAKVSIILFVILEIITFYLQPNLFSMSWISLKAESAITLLFAAVGETFVLLVGGIDLSIAGVISITSSVAAVYMQDSWISVILISVLCLCIGAGVGFFNGFIIQKFRIQPFIVTFATWYICGGIAYLVLPRDGGEVPQKFIGALTHRFGGKFSVALIIIIACLILWTWFKKTRLGISLYAVGNNAHAASLNGINVKESKLFCICSIRNLCSNVRFVQSCSNCYRVSYCRREFLQPGDLCYSNRRYVADRWYRRTVRNHYRCTCFQSYQ